MLVWLTDWQLSEDHLLIRVGDVVDWTLYESDRGWLARLFADGLSIEWQFDTYGEAVEQPSRRVRGEVTSLLSARGRHTMTDEGLVPGPARLVPVGDTSGSWAPGDERSDSLYGYVLTLDVRDGGTGR
ncbi:DUF6578 domain-containing protein [Herbiconiux sp. P15]|uniref:DUF6578 domain-containing protein n=1 Tax=Herbiconiux liukaitaii TaxID=3342799 RepID=UPI0035BA9D55